MVVSASSDVISICGICADVVSICADVVSTGDDVLGVAASLGTRAVLRHTPGQTSVHSRISRGRRSAAKLLSKDEARRIAVGIQQRRISARR
jgi:hypothetical protein